MQERVNAFVVGADGGIADDMVVTVNGHAITGKATQRTQVDHSVIPPIRRSRQPIDKRVGRQHRTHALRLRRACYVPSVIDRICLRVRAAQRADIDHAGLSRSTRRLGSQCYRAVDRSIQPPGPWH